MPRPRPKRKGENKRKGVRPAQAEMRFSKIRAYEQLATEILQQSRMPVSKASVRSLSQRLPGILKGEEPSIQGKKLKAFKKRFEDILIKLG